jgi:hypothetical protein
LLGALDTHLHVTRGEKAKHQDDLVTIACLKQKDAEEFEPFTLKKKVIDLGGGKSHIVLEPTEDKMTDPARSGQPAGRPSAQRDKVYALIEGRGPAGISGPDWWAACKAAGISKSTANACRQKLVELGQVIRDGPDHFVAACHLPAGQAGGRSN